MDVNGIWILPVEITETDDLVCEKPECPTFCFSIQESASWSTMFNLDQPMVPVLRGLPGLEEMTLQGSWLDGAMGLSRDTFRTSSPASTSTSASNSTSSSASSSGTARESEPSSVWPRKTWCGSEGSTIWFLFSRCSRSRSRGTVFFLGRKREVCGRFWPAVNTCLEPSRLKRMPVRLE